MPTRRCGCSLRQATHQLVERAATGRLGDVGHRDSHPDEARAVLASDLLVLEAVAQRDERLGRDVALKFLHWNASVSSRKRLQREARALAGLGRRAEATNALRQLSGGEQQRIAIARAIAARPGILFADEPTGNLDSSTGERIIELLFALNSEQRTTLVMVTHDEQLASRCERRIRLESGRILSEECCT